MCEREQKKNIWWTKEANESWIKNSVLVNNDRVLFRFILSRKKSETILCLNFSFILRFIIIDRKKCIDLNIKSNQILLSIESLKRIYQFYRMEMVFAQQKRAFV